LTRHRPREADAREVARENRVNSLPISAASFDAG
jgi:hypothetical protein